MNKFRRILLSIVLVLIAGCGVIFAGCEKNNYSKVSLTLSDTNITLTKVGNDLGESKNVSAKVSGTKGDANKKITFVSANSEVATVSEVSFSGDTTTVSVTAQNGGTTIIYAIAEGNVKKIINVSVVQEASQIKFLSSYKPLIVRGENFYIDINNVLVYPSATSDKSFNAKLYDLNDNFIADFSLDVNGNYVLYSGATENLNIGTYVIKLFKQTSKEVLTAQTNVAVKEKINANSFAIVDMKGNPITNLNLSTNSVAYDVGQNSALGTSLQFQICYTYQNPNGSEVSEVQVFNSPDFSYEFSTSNNYQITYHEVQGESGITSYYLIEAKAKTIEEKVSLNIAYVGYELSYKVAKQYLSTITTYPEDMQIILEDKSSFSVGDEILNIYTEDETSFVISNIPTSTDANSLYLEISQIDFNKIAVFKINGNDVAWQARIEVTVGDNIAVQGKTSGDSFSFIVRNKDYLNFYKVQNVKVWEAVKISKYYDENKVLVEGAPVVFGAEDNVETIYFTVQNDSASVYFDGFSFVSENEQNVRVYWEKTSETVEEDKEVEEGEEPEKITKNLYKLTLVCLKDSAGKQITITPKNSGTEITDKTFKVEVITAINFEDVAKNQPRIHFINNELESLVNVSSFERNPNNNSIESITLNNKFIDGEVMQGVIKFNLITYPENATIKFVSMGVGYGSENEVTRAISKSFYNDKITLTFQDGILTVSVGSDGWEKEYVIYVTFSYYDAEANQREVTKQINLSAYKKISSSNLIFSQGEVNLVSKNTAGDVADVAYDYLTFVVQEASTLKKPEISFSLASSTTTRLLVAEDGREWTVIEGAALTLLYSIRTNGLCDIYIFSNSEIKVARLSDYIIATVVQDGISYNKFIRVSVINYSVSTALLIDDNYKTDENGDIYYVFKEGDEISLNNSLLPVGTESKIKYEILEGSDYLYVETDANGNQALRSTGAGINGLVKIYSTASKMFNNDSLINHFINGKYIIYSDVNENLSKTVRIRVENGSQDAPYSIFTTNDFLGIIGDASNKIYYELKANVVVSVTGTYALGDSNINNIILNGNGYSVTLDKPFVTSVSNSELTNVSFILGDSELIANSANNVTFSNVKIYNGHSFVVKSLVSSTFINSTFYRDIKTTSFFGIAESIIDSSVQSNTFEFVVKTSAALEEFAGVAGSVNGSTISNNDIYFYQQFGGEMPLNLAGKGAFIATTAKISQVRNNSIFSYYNEKVVDGTGEFAGLAHTSYGSNFQYNSVYAQFRGVAVVYNIYKNDESISTNYAITKIENNNFVVSNGEKGKLVSFAGEFAQVYESNSKDVVYKDGNSYYWFDSVNKVWKQLLNIRYFNCTIESTTYYFAYDGENFYSVNEDLGLDGATTSVNGHDLVIVDEIETTSAVGSVYIESIYNASWKYKAEEHVGTEDEDSGWIGLGVDENRTHYFNGTNYFVLDVENNRFYKTANDFNTSLLTANGIFESKDIIYVNNSTYEALIDNDWRELDNLSYTNAVTESKHQFVERAGENGAWGYYNKSNKYVGIIQNTVYINADADEFDENKLVVASANLFVNDENNGGSTSTFGSGVIKLTMSAFASEGNFTSFDSEEVKYSGLSFTYGRYEQYYVNGTSINRASDLAYTDKIWTMTSERPVLVKRASNDSYTGIDISKASNITIEAKENSKLILDETESAYLYLLPVGFEQGKEIVLTDLFTVKIDSAVSNNFDFVISGTTNFEKTQSGNIKVNGYGYLKITVYAKTNATVKEEIILYVYENNLGKVYNSETGDEITSDSNVLVRKNENFSCYVVNENVVITLSGLARVGESDVYTATISDEIEVEKTIVIDGLNFDLGSIFTITPFTGAISASISFEQNEFTKIDVVNATVEITTDRGVINDIDSLLTVGFENINDNLPDLSYRVVGSYYVEETILGVEYTTTYFDLQFYFADYDELIDNNNTGDYKISLSIESAKYDANSSETPVITDIKYITLKQQSILTDDYAHYVQAGDAYATLTEEEVYSINEKPVAYITPGVNSILDLFIYPYYADFAYAEITSNKLTNSKGETVGLAFEQKALYDGKFEHYNFAALSDGIKLDKVSSGSNADYAFDGHFYVKTILTSESSYFLTSNDSFTVTVRFFDDNDAEVYVTTINILVETINAVNIDMRDYIAAGVETQIDMDELSEIEGELSFNKYLIVDGIETQSYNNYITGPYRKDDGKYYILVDINVFNASTAENPTIKLKLSSVVTKEIRGIYQSAVKTDITEIKKFIINSVNIDSEESYLSSAYIPVHYSISATYYKHTSESGVVNGQSYTKSVEDEIAALEAQLNNPSSYFNSEGKIIGYKDDGTIDPETLSFFKFEEGNWAWKLNENGKHEELKIYAKVENTNLNFTTIFTFNYEGVSPTLTSNPSKFKEFRATMSPKIGADVTEDHPDPIYTADEFLAMTKNKHYRLMSNIILKNYQPIDLECLSLDGNGFVIYIDSFDIELDNSNKVIEISLFSDIATDTLVKNVIVAYKSMTFDVVSAGSVYFAGFAVNNYGFIYNSEVLAMDIAAKDEDKFLQNKDKEKDENGNDIYYNLGSALAAEYISTIQINAPVDIAENTVVSGFVCVNQGNISNCRVGRTTESFKFQTNTDKYKTKEPAIVGHFENLFKNFINSGNGFKFIATGEVSGFVGSNGTGISDQNVTITSSYVSGLAIENVLSDTEIAKSAGFVISNNGIINGCFVYGQRLIEDTVSLTGSAILSATHVGGFAYQNSRRIEDCLSNIKIITNAISAGFCYKNTSAIEQCISLCKSSQSLINSPFIGHTGLKSLNDGETKNCYYYDENKAIAESTEDRSATALKSIFELADSDNYSGFAFGDEALSTWFIVDKDKTSSRPMLISANEIAVTKYDLKASSQSTNDYMDDAIDNHPYVISSASTWHKQFIALSIVIEYTNDSGDSVKIRQIPGSYRLITSIDLSTYAAADDATNKELSYFCDFAGRLDGNGLSVSNMTLSIGETLTSVGLFSSINLTSKNSVVVKNLVVNFSKVNNDNASQTIAAGNTFAVGGLAGIINDAKIFKITLLGNYEVLGQYYAGGLAGIIVGSKTVVNNVKNELSARTSSHDLIDLTETIDDDGIITHLDILSSNIVADNSNNAIILRKYNLSNKKGSIIAPISSPAYIGFTGSIAGIIDIAHQTPEEIENEQNTVGAIIVNGDNYVKGNVVNTRSEGVSRVVGTFAGGMFGFVGSYTFVHDSSFIANTCEDSRLSVQQNIIGYQVLGGIAAVNLGTIRYGYVEHTNQKNLDKLLFEGNILNSSVNLFRIITDNQTANIYVGGVVGINFASDTSLSGILKDCYNKVALIPAYNNAEIQAIFATNAYEETSVFEDENITSTRVVGGLVGISKVTKILNAEVTAIIQTSFVTAQVAGEIAGGVIGQIGGDIKFELVNVLNNVVTDLGVRTYLSGKNYYPASLYSLQDETYYANRSGFGLVSGKIYDGDEIVSVGLNGRALWVQTKTIEDKSYSLFGDKTISKIKFAEENDIKLIEKNGDLIPSNLVRADSDGSILEYLSLSLQRNILTDIEGKFTSFPQISDADWDTTDCNEDKKIPYPNFGIVTSLMITNEEDFKEMTKKPTLHYTVLPESSTYDIIITTEVWQALSKDFTGTLRGVAKKGTENDEKPVYPTIKIVLKVEDESNVALFKTLRRATIENLNIEFLIQTNSSGKILDANTNSNFGVLAANAVSSTINNVSVKLSTTSITIVQGENQTEVSTQSSVNPKNYKYFGGIVAYAKNTLFQNCSADFNIIDGDNNIQNRFIGGIVGEAIKCSFNSCSFGSSNTVVSLDQTISGSKIDGHFGGIVAETSVMTNASIALCEVTLSKLELKNTTNVTYYVGGIVGHASSDCDSATTECEASIVSSIVKIGNLTSSALTNNNLVMSFIGGIAGYTNAKIDGTNYVYACLSSYSGAFFGAATGYQVSNISGVTAEVVVYNSNLHHLGGIVGCAQLSLSGFTSLRTHNSSIKQKTGLQIFDCAASVKVASVKSTSGYFITYLGGIIGTSGNGEYINKCFANVDFVVANTARRIGGIVGEAVGGLSNDKSSTIENCYTAGKISANALIDNNYPGMGGIIGLANSINCYLTMNNCYSICDIGTEADFSDDTQTIQNHGTDYIGLLIGTMYSSNFYSFSNNYAIRECNMELFPVGTKDAGDPPSGSKTTVTSNTQVSGISAVYISEFYDAANSSTSFGDDWKYAANALPQLNVIATQFATLKTQLKDSDLDARFAHESGSRINPVEITQSNLENISIPSDYQPVVTADGKNIAKDNLVYCYRNLDNAFGTYNVNYSGKNLMNTLRLEWNEVAYQPTDLVIFDYNKLYYMSASGYIRQKGNTLSMVVTENSVTFTQGESQWWGVGLPIKVEPNTTYTISGTRTDGNNTKFLYALYKADGSFEKFEQVTTDTNVLNMSKTIKTGQNTQTLVLVVAGYNKGTVVSMTNIQVEKGSEKTAYEQYPFQPLRNSCNYVLTDGTVTCLDLKRGNTNYLKYAEQAGSDGGVDYSVDSNGVITLNGTATGDFINSGWYAPISMNITLPAGDYTLVSLINPTTLSSTDYYRKQQMYIYYRDGSGIEFGTGGREGICNFTLSKTTSISVYCFYYGGNTFENFKLYPMLLAGTYTSANLPIYFTDIGGYNGWIVSKVASANLTISGTTKENAVISGIKATTYTPGNLTLNGIMTNCSFGTSTGAGGLTGSNSVITTLGSAYIETINIHVNGNTNPRGYFIDEQVTYVSDRMVKIKNISATGSAKAGLIATFGYAADKSHSSKIIIDDVKLNVAITHNASSGRENGRVGALFAEIFGPYKVYIYNTYNRGNVTESSSCSQNAVVGGLIARCDGSYVDSANDYTVRLNNCFNIGNVKFNGSVNSGLAIYVGGLIGRATGKVVIDNCFNAGFIDSIDYNNYYVGGLIGQAIYSYVLPSVSNSYSASMRSDLEKGANLNGIAGGSSSITLSNVYYAQDLLFNETSAYGTGCDYAEIQKVFTSSHWSQARGDDELNPLPYLAIGEFKNGIPSGISGTLFAPNLAAKFKTIGDNDSYKSQVNYITKDLTANSQISLGTFEGILLGGNHTISTTNNSLFTSLSSGARIIGLNIDLTLNDLTYNSETLYLGSLLSNVSVEKLYLNNIQATINGTVVKNANLTNIGGLIGRLNPVTDVKIVGCGVSGVVSVKNETQASNNYLAVGGLISSIEGNGGSSAGGTVTISKCYSTLSVVDVYRTVMMTSFDFGGFVAWAYKNVVLHISDSYYAGYLDIYTNKYTKFDSFVGSTAANNNADPANSVSVTHCYDAGVYYAQTASAARSRLAQCPTGENARDYEATNCFTSSDAWSENSVWSSNYSNFDKQTDGFFSSGVTRTNTTHTWVQWPNALPTLTWQYALGANNLVYKTDSNGALVLPSGTDNNQIGEIKQIGVIKVTSSYSSINKDYNGNGFYIAAEVPVFNVLDRECLNVKNVGIDLIENINSATTFTYSDTLYQTCGAFACGAIDYGKVLNITNVWTASSNSSKINISSGSSCRVGGFIGLAVVSGLSTQGVVINNISIAVTDNGDSGWACVGGIVGQAGNTLGQSGIAINNGSITGGDRTGGLVGHADIVNVNSSTISINNGNVTGGNSGGIVGNLYPFHPGDAGAPNISNNYGIKIESAIVYNNGNVTGSGNAGGIVGRMVKSFYIISGSKVYNNGNITATGEGCDAGGFVGYIEQGNFGNHSSYPDAIYLYNTGTVLSNNANSKGRAGGIAGMINSVNNKDGRGNVYLVNATVENSGSVQTNSSSDAGGIIGYAYGSITITGSTLSNSDSVSGRTSAGGIIGYAGGNITLGYANGSITSCDMYNNGDINSASGSAGGIIGYAAGSISIFGKQQNSTNIENEGDVEGSSAAGGLFGFINGGLYVNYGKLSGDSEAKAQNSIVSLNNGTSGMTVSSSDNAGGIAARVSEVIISGTSTTMSNIINSGKELDIYGTNNVGGIFGLIEGQLYISNATISNSGTDSFVKNNTEADVTYVGGIAGFVRDLVTVTNNVKISNSVTTSSVSKNSGNTIVGGIFGHVGSATIDMTADVMQNETYTKTYGIYNSGTVIGTFHPAGGIFGGRNGIITIKSGTVCNTAQINSYIYTGGIIGEVNTVNIESGIVYNTGSISGGNGTGDSRSYAGGIVGRVQIDMNIYSGSKLPSIKPLVYNTNSVDAANSAGGIVGRVNGSLKIGGGKVYNTGNVKAGSEAGGIVGHVAYQMFIYGDGTVVSNGASITSGGTINNETLGRITASSSAGGIAGGVGSLSNEGGGLFVVGTCTTHLDGREGSPITSPWVQNSAVLSGDGYAAKKVGGIVGHVGKDALKSIGGTTKNIGRFSADGNSHDYIGGIAGYVEGSVHWEGGTIDVDLTNSEGINYSSNTYAGGYIGAVGTTGHTGTVDVFIYISLTNREIIQGTIAGGIIGEVCDKAIHINGGVNAIELKNDCTYTGDRDNPNAKDFMMGRRVGGIIGWINSSSRATEINNCTLTNNSGVRMMCTGVDTTNGVAVGGLFGRVNTSSFTVASNATLTNSGTEVGVWGGSNEGSATYYLGGIIGYVKEGSVSLAGSITNNTGMASYKTVQSPLGGIIGYCGDINISGDSTSIINNGQIAESYYAGGIVGRCSKLTMSGGDVENNNKISAYAYAGGLVGYSTSVIVDNSDITNYADIHASTYAGGLIGYSTTTEVKGKSNLSNSGDICRGSEYKPSYSGGIFGYTGTSNFSGESKTTNSGAVYGATDVGGIIGHSSTVSVLGSAELSNRGRIQSSETTGHVSSAKDVGGLFGELSSLSTEGSPCKLTNSGYVSSGGYAGGILGYCSGSITFSNQGTSNIQNSGNINGYYFVGGIFGLCSGNVTALRSNIINTGSVDAYTNNDNSPYSFAGGVWGKLTGSISTGNQATIKSKIGGSTTNGKRWTVIGWKSGNDSSPAPGNREYYLASSVDEGYWKFIGGTGTNTSVAYVY